MHALYVHITKLSSVLVWAILVCDGRYYRHKSRTANRIRERRERVQRYHAEMGQARCIRCAGVFQGLAAVGLPCILIVVFIVMLGLYLDGDTSASFT